MLLASLLVVTHDVGSVGDQGGRVGHDVGGV